MHQAKLGLLRWLSGKKFAWQCQRPGDRVSIPGSGRSPGEGNGNLLQYSCILGGKNPVERGARWATVHGVAKRQTQVSARTVTRLHPLYNSLVKGSRHNWACTMQSYHNIIDYISCAVHYVRVIYLFCNWWFMLLNPFPYFIHSPSSSPLATMYSICPVYDCFVLFVHFFVFLYSM